MREEYTGREVAVDAIRPLLDMLPEEARRLRDAGTERVPWTTFCALLDRLHGLPDVDPRAVGARAVFSAAYKYHRRLRLVGHVLTLEDLLRFVLFPRNPIDFACVNSAVTSEAGCVHVLLYVHGRCEPHATFFELVLGAATELVRLLDLPEGDVSMIVSGSQAHFTFTYAEQTGLATSARRHASRLLSGVLLRFIIVSGYPDLVAGRKMFEDQLIERAKAEAQLNAAQKAFESRLAQLDDVIAEFDDASNLTYVSPNLQRLTGMSGSARATDFARLVHTEDLKRVKAGVGNALVRGQPTRIHDFRIVDAEGRTRWIEIDFRRARSADGVERTIAVGRDITERRRLSEERQALDRQLEQTQRLEVLGVLAGGIAHDFNNLLSPIIGQAELASLELNRDSKLYSRLEIIRDGAEKAVDLVRQLMTYAGGGKPSASAPVDLGKETTQLLGLAKTSISPNVKLSLSLADDAVVFGDAAQLRQVIMNLIVNAAESIGDAPGLIEVEIRKQDGQVLLAVTDDGCGMDEETKQRAFEPFYSTKFTGRGLGLSAVMGIVRSHGGELRVRSAPGEGSCFEMRLAGISSAAVGAEREESFAGRFSGRALLVDDEPAVLEVSRALLEHLGYQVTCAGDGKEALEVFARGTFEVLVVDLVMPKADGRQVLAGVREVAPYLPVVVVSGYRPSLHVDEFKTDAYTRFLNKPYRAQELGQVLSELCLQEQARAPLQAGS